MNIALVITGITLLVLFVWMAVLSSRRKRLAVEKAEREKAYRRAIARQHDQEKQERTYKAETGHIPTQLYLAKEAENHNPREALHWYERAAHLGSEIAMYGVVRVCARAKEDQVLKQKSKFWQLAIEAHNGSQQAKFDMGKALLKGMGVEVNIDKAISAIEEVANEGNAEAQIYMGDWYLSEANLSPQPKLASEWYFRAAQQNNPDAQIKLGLNYRDGIGVQQSLSRATYWFEVAGERGSSEGQFRAGEIWMGRGAKGNAIAYLWLFISSYFGHEEAKPRRDDLGNILGVDAVVGLQAMAKPLLKKLADGPLIKHSLINALNKLYKRESYFPDRDGNEFMVGTEHQANTEQAEHQADTDMTEQPSDELPAEPATQSLDYSVSQMDKHSG
jgi:TPR repeat protein